MNQAFTWGMVNCSGLGVEAVYTTGQAGAGLSSAQVGLGLLRLHLQFGPDLDQEFDIIVAPKALSVCYASKPQVCVPDDK